MTLARRLRDYFSPREVIDTSPRISDEVKCTTCYMCACRCGIKVHLKDGAIRYIEGNRDHPVNRGVICGKGASGIMQQALAGEASKAAQAGRRARLRRVPRDRMGRGDRDGGRVAVVGPRRRTRKSSPFSPAATRANRLTGYWATQFGTPNFAAHGGFCSVNMAAAGMYTLGGSFWEFGEPDWARTRFFLMFGVAEDHDSNPIKIALSGLRRRGAKFVSVNPVRTGYSAIADEWIGIRPGTDGLFVLSLIHELLKADRIDVDYLGRYTNAGWLVIQAPGAADDGLFARNEAGEPLVLEPSGSLASGMAAGVSARLVGEAMLPDGRRAVPVFQLVAERYLDPALRAGGRRRDLRHSGRDHSPARRRDGPYRLRGGNRARRAVDRLGRAAPRDDARAGRSRCMRCAASRPIRTGSRPAARCICCRCCSARSMCRAAGATSRRIRSLPRPARSRPAGRSRSPPANRSPGSPLGYPLSPEDLLLDADGRPFRIDKAFSWDAPIAAHGMMQMVIRNAWKGDPYPIDTLFMYMANMAWNSAMNTAETMRMLTDKDPATGEYRIPRIIYSDAYYSETVAYADLVLPDTTYLERWDCISLLDRPIGGVDGPADAIRQPVLTPDRDVRPFQDVLIEIGARLGLPGFVDAGGRAALPRRLPRLHRQPRAAARASGRSPAGAAPRARMRDGVRRTRTSSSAISRMAASGSTSCPRTSSISSTPTRPISKPPSRWD